MTTVISVENLSKIYRLGQIGTGTFAHDLNVWWAKIRGKPNPMQRIGEAYHGNRDGEEVWALKDINFSVDQGEVLGIIGRNGAGKSTLLKIISRVTAPTSGKVKIKGRVASLLEVGTGFHPELTGRENIYLNGTILGMNRREIKQRFDEIVDFSGVENFIDTPVKRYSSGMYVRLAFAVAAHLEPEILLVDEVLAVGDAEFQKKCLGKMGEVAKEGRTVLFVSHNMAAIQNLCSKCIWIDKGKDHQIGESREVINAYLEKPSEQDFQGEMKLANWPNRYGKGGVRIIAARLLDENDNITTLFFRMHGLSFEFDFESNCAHALLFSSTITTEAGIRILHLSQYDTPGLLPNTFSGLHRVRFSIPSLPLAEGNYNLLLGIHSENQEPLDVVRAVLSFEVQDKKDGSRPFKTDTKITYSWTSNQCSITPLTE